MGRIEMHLSSRENQIITVGDETVNFNEAETIHTESSYKYTVEEFSGLALAAGFELITFWTDVDDLFSLHYYQVNQ
jgi:uncharacterized SAM-dependent methyltransferase